MEQSGRLSVSLASFSMLSWLVLLAGSQEISPAVPPSGIRLSVSPPSSTFAWGEQISLTCSLPEGHRATGFIFHVKTREGRWTLYAQQAENTLDLSTTHLETTETFSCSYWGENSAGESFQSSLSNNIVISITVSQATSAPPAAPPAPRLSVSPSGSSFIQGEQVLLTCSPPPGQRAKDFLFYEKNTNGTWSLYKEQAENTLDLSTTDMKTNQTFACSYQGGNSAGESSQSLQSNHVVISIPEPPPAATISLHPLQPVYIQGEQVTLECSAPERLHVAGYKFYKKKQRQGSKELPNRGTGQYHAFRASKNTAGQYSCLYWMLQSGQEVQSPRSRLVSVAVTDRSRPPLLSVSPQQAAYRSGESVLFTCSVPEIHHVSRIQFFKDGRQFHSIPPSSTLVSSTLSLHVLPQDGGTYYCMYHILESGQEILSQDSTPIRISVMGDVPSAPTPAFSSTTQALLGSTVIKGHFTSITMLTSTALQPSSSQSAATYTTKAHPKFMVLHGSTASTSSSSQSNRHYTALTSTDPQNTTTSPTSRDVMKNPMQPKEEISEGLSPLWLAIGFGSGGILLLLALLVHLYRRKYKDSRRISSRTYWRTLNSQTSVKMRRCNAVPIGNSINPQEENWPGQPLPVNQDWGILPKAKSPMTKRGAPTQEKQRNEDTDFKADLKFSEIDPTYTLLGMSCSTFFQEENNRLSKKAHICNEIFV